MTRPEYALCLLLFFLFISVLPLGAALSAQDMSPQEIAGRIDDLYRGGSSHAIMKIKVFTGPSARETMVEAWSKGRKYTLVRTLEPAGQQGHSIVKLGNSIWSYLPDVDRVIKLPLSMAGAPWLGSHLTNDDAVRGDMLSEDYIAEITFSGTRERTGVIEITLVPEPSTQTVWSKVVATVRRSDLIPLEIEFYGDKANLVRTMTYSDIRKLGSRMLPSTIRITPAGNDGAFTEITYEAIRFEVEIDGDFFSLKNLKNPESL